LGIVVQANHASLGSHETSNGTTIYDGDLLSTEAGGTLQAHGEGVTLQLAEKSSAIVRNGKSAESKEFEAELVAGSVIMSVTTGTPWAVATHSARVRPEANHGVVQVQILGKREVAIFAQRGPALLYYRDETATIPESKIYRLLLDPDDEEATSGGGARPGHHGRAFVLFGVAGAGLGIPIPLARHHKHKHDDESPDRP
jgi:hypothetical protein